MGKRNKGVQEGRRGLDVARLRISLQASSLVIRSTAYEQLFVNALVLPSRQQSAVAMCRPGKTELFFKRADILNDAAKQAMHESLSGRKSCAATASTRHFSLSELIEVVVEKV